MDNIIKRFNQSIISIGNSALMNRSFDFKIDIDYLKYIRLKRSKDLYNHLLEDDIYVSESKEDSREILNKISFE